MSSFVLICFGAVIFSVLSSVIWYGKKNFAESAVIGVIMYFFGYVLCSMALFVVDKYSLFRAASMNFILDFLLMAAAVYFRRTKPFKLKELFKCELSIKNMIIPALICLLAVPFVSSKNEIFGMGQDQGVYQIQAIGFMNGDNKRQKDIEEYHKLETQEERDTFIYAVKNALRGYDIPGKEVTAYYPENSYDENVSEVSGIFHGIPTYSSMLAMWGEIFGMENMIDIETVFYICMIFVIYFICCNLKLKTVSCICACISGAAAPVIIWVAKSSLTEMFLALIPLMFMYFMTDDENSQYKWLSFIPIAVFGCYHVSVYTMVPMFFMIYGGMYFFTRQKQYAVLMTLTPLGYLLSYFMMRLVQPVYTMNNYSPIFVGGLGVHNLTSVVVIFSTALIVISGVFIFIVSRSNKKFDAVVFNEKAQKSRVFRAFLALLIVLPIAFIIIKAFSKYASWDEANHLALWGFAVNSGFLLFILSAVGAVILPKFYIQKNSRLVVFLMFFYCILIYSAFLRYDIQYYFYYSRYLAPFIPIAAIFAVLTLDRFGGKIMYPALAVGLYAVLPYDSFLMNNKDDTRMEWSVLEDISDVISEDDCILIDREYMAHLWLPLKNITGADVYPRAEILENQFSDLQSKYERVLFITNKLQNTDDFQTVYKNTINHSEDDQNIKGRFIPMPLKYWEVKDNIYVYSYEKYKFVYTAENDYEKFNGFSMLENDFCWSSEDKTKIFTKLSPSDYDVTLSFGTVIPFDNLSVKELNLSLYINGKKVGSTMITPQNNCEDIQFNVPQRLLNDGYNDVEIETDMWNVSEVNPDDTRIVGIPLKSIVFSRTAD